MPHAVKLVRCDACLMQHWWRGDLLRLRRLRLLLLPESVLQRRLRPGRRLCAIGVDVLFLRHRGRHLMERHSHISSNL
jgi:hypothetical protein